MEEILISVVAGGGLALGLRWAYYRLRDFHQSIDKKDMFPPYDKAIDEVSDTAAGRYLEYKRRNHLG